jgi:1-acyl-sn-glycerol-3-phosphate acyltransferase
MRPDVSGRAPNLPVRFRGSALAAWLLRRIGWTVCFDGLPARQGVIVVAPHTSNWDFVVGLLAKWAIGIQARFWAKHTLFAWPLFGRWLRWLGGVPIERSRAHGVVSATAEVMAQARERGELFWLAVTPEGTRKRTEGWRSGFYHLAQQAGVPVGVAVLDFGRRRIVLNQFLSLSGDVEADMAWIAACFDGVQGCCAEHAAPVRLR